MEHRFTLHTGTDPQLSAGALWWGPGDPQMQLGPERLVRAMRLASGPATLEVSWNGTRVNAKAWGDGANEALELAPGLVGEQGEVLVAEKVVGFKKIKISTMENVGSGEVELPQQEMQTTAAWLTIDPALLAEISSHRDELVDGLRALTRLLHSLAPIFLLCDIRDIGAWLGDGSPAAW